MSTPSREGRQVSLRQLTKSTLEEILGYTEGNSMSPNWSVLIYDDFAMGLIAPILKVGDLRKMGVTLFMKLSASREAVTDAPAIYICQPTEEAVKRIAKDCVSDMYQSFNIHWTSPMPRKLLELLAVELQPRRGITNVKVKDQFLNFVAPVSDMFTLNIPDSFFTLNSGQNTVEQLDEHLDSCAEGIVHVLLTLQMIPIIAWSRGNLACIDIAEKLKSKIKDMKHYLPHAEVSRPILLLSDRTCDLSTGLVQPFAYRALLHDTLGMSLNKVVRGKKEFEVDEKDLVWQELSGEEVGEVIEKVGEYLKAIDQEEKESKRKKQQSDLNEQTQFLMKALENASSYTERKRSLETHMQLCDLLSREIKKHRLDEFNGIAEEMMFASKYDHDKIRDLCKSDDIPLSHRMRLALVYSILSGEDGEKTDKPKELEGYISRKAGKTDADPEDVDGKYHLAYKCIQRIMAANFSAKGRHQEKTTKSFFSTRKIGDFVKNIASGGQRQLPHTRMIDAILRRSDSSKPIIDELDFWDPKTAQQVDPTPLRFNQALVFVAGGGNYVEYEDLKKWEKLEENKGKSVIYGTTQIVTGTEMLQQMSHLGDEYENS